MTVHHTAYDVVHDFRCDYGACDTRCNLRYLAHTLAGTIPAGWYTIRRQAERTFSELHFCSGECLLAYVKEAVT